MIRIVGIQKSEQIGQEFVLLQNQGSMRVNLKGHAVICNEVLVEGAGSLGMHIFTEAENVMPGQYVLLRTCPGSSHWSNTNEGQRVLYTYMGRLNTIWSRYNGPFHMLAPQHSFCERQAEALLV